jgi:D-aspartate ligase
VEMSFMKDPRDGLYKLMDLNPRVWNWNSIGHRAGTDFPYLLWRQTLGEAVPGGRAQIGVKWFRLTLDVPTAVQMMRRGMLSPKEYFASLRGPKELATFAIDDPLPAVADIPLLLAMELKRNFRSVWGSRQHRHAEGSPRSDREVTMRGG